MEIEVLEGKLMSLYGIYKKQENVIKGIEHGTYTYSKKAIKIPETDKPPILTKEGFPIIFDLLERNPTAMMDTKTKLLSSTSSTKKINFMQTRTGLYS